MKRMVFIPTVIFLILCSLVAKAQTQAYYKVNVVVDNNYVPLSQTSDLYKRYIGQILTISMNPYSPDLYIKMGTYPFVSYPFAGQDQMGNNIYAFSDIYGNVMYTDYTGHLNYVLISNDFSEINYTMSFDNVILVGVPATQEEFNEMMWAEANKRAQIEMLEGGYSSPESVSSGMSEQWYRSTYAKWEGIAKSTYESLTSTGIQITDRNGKHEGYSDWGNTSSETRMKVLLSDAQRQMRDIRNEAARNGYVISMSSWETARVN